MIVSGDQGTTPVIISGAGPVGLTLALALARAGVQTIVLERKTELDAHSRATLLVPRSLELFEHLGVLPALLSEGQRSDAITILDAKNRHQVLSFDFSKLADRTTTPFALALSQDRTEHILLDAVRATGRSEIVFGDALARFEQADGEVTVTTASGQQLRSAFLVGADGAHSTVREQLGWQLEGKTYPTRAMLADVRIAPEADLTDGWLADLDAPAFTIGIRFADGVWRIIEAAVPEDVTDEMLPARAQRLATSLFGSSAWRETLWTAAYRKHERRAPRYFDRRVVLAGDAAHLNSPAGGQGLNAGLADVAELANALLSAFAAPDRVDGLLGAYERERIAAFDHDIRGFTDRLEMMESAPAWLRKLGFSMVGVLRALGIERHIAAKLSMLEAD